MASDKGDAAANGRLQFPQGHFDIPLKTSEQHRHHYSADEPSSTFLAAQDVVSRL